MAVTDEQLDEIQQISQRIRRVRLLVGDTESQPGYIVRKKHTQRTLFRARIKTIRKLEAQRTRLMMAIVNSSAQPPAA